MAHRAVNGILIFICFFFLNACGGSGSNSISSQTSPFGGQNSPTPPSHANQWTWVSGSNLANQSGSYGQQGTPASSNAPPARYGAATWKDAAGNLWLFGGITAPTSTSDTYYNDLWKFSSGQWTWVGGSNTTNEPSNFGALNVAAPSNIAGGRSNAATWMDNSGNFWLFGGGGVFVPGVGQDMNNLWRYSNDEWTWMGGPQNVLSGAPGVYGTKGVADPGNLPGPRSYAMSWTDKAGNFWLFGGLGDDSVGNWGDLNDLWKYSNGQWTWVSGSNLVNQSAVYGNMGIPDPTNTPGGRINSSAWIDSNGDLWLFGGEIRLQVANGVTGGMLNDLWKFSNGQWTWMGGSNQPDQPGVYGTKGVASSANMPGGRSGAATWIDASGNVWLFSGCCSPWASDLWKYSNGQWTWIGGTQTTSGGTYGTLGIASSSNIPGSRVFAAAWTDNEGHLWLFGGSGNDSTGTSASSLGYLNDLWEYQP